MATMTIGLPDGKHERLRRLAERRGISLNKLVGEWAGVAPAQFDAGVRFSVRPARGGPERGLELLDKADRWDARRRDETKCKPAKPRDIL